MLYVEKSSAVVYKLESGRYNDTVVCNDVVMPRHQTSYYHGDDELKEILENMDFDEGTKPVLSAS